MVLHTVKRYGKRSLRIEADAGTMQQHFVARHAPGGSAQMPGFANPVKHGLKTATNLRSLATG
jgi:hypothetical protein